MVRMGLAITLLCSAALAQQPRIDTLSPTSGPIAGGTIVRISGASFTGATITLDRAPVALRSRTDTQIELAMPAHVNGFAILAVASSSGTAYTRFLYLPPRLEDLPAGSITTIAGVGPYGGEYGPAVSAWVPVAIGMAFDRAGQLYFADTHRNRIMRIRSDGILEPFAGNGLTRGPRPAGKTPALEVAITFPRSIAFDSAGNLIVPDDDAYVWRVDPNGLAEIIAGNGQVAKTASPEGVPALGTAIGQPSFVAVDGNDDVYVLDWPSARVHRIDRNGILTSYAGSGTYGFSGDGGPAREAQFNEGFNDLGGLAFDRSDNLLILDAGNSRIRRVNKSTGTIETIVGPQIDGHTLDNLRGLAVGPDDAVYFSNAAEVYRRAADGTITKIASGRTGFSPDGTRLAEAALGIVYSLKIDGDGNLLYGDSLVGRIRRIDLATKVITTIVGTGPSVFGEGQQTLAAAASVTGLSFLPSGELVMSWFAGANGVFKVDPAGRLVRIAGSAQFGKMFEVPALEAAMGSASVSVGRGGILDVAGSTVASIDAAGIIHHTAGQPGKCGFSGDGGKGVDALLCQPWDVIRDRSGNVFIADTNNNRVRRVRAGDGVIETVAGSGPVNGLERYDAGTFCGDGGPATAACLNTPYGLAFGDEDDLFVCEQGRIRRIDRNGTIQTLARPGCSKLAWAFGNLYSAGDGVRRTSRAGKVTVLTRLGEGLSGDGGPASEAYVRAGAQGGGIAVDAEGNLFFNDAGNERIRAIRFGAVLAPPGATVEVASTGKAVTARVRDSERAPAEGVRVDFAVPPAGASCSLSSPFAITDAAGAATVSCVPNCIAGSFTVSARPAGSASAATATLTNVAAPCRRRAVRP